MADIIDELAGMSDEDLAKKIGLDQKLADAKKHLGELAALSGEARTIAADRIAHQLAPNVWTDEWGYIARDAQREVKRSAMDEMMDDSPASMEPR